MKTTLNQQLSPIKSTRISQNGMEDNGLHSPFNSTPSSLEEDQLWLNQLLVGNISRERAFMSLYHKYSEIITILHRRFIASNLNKNDIKACYNDALLRVEYQQKEEKLTISNKTTLRNILYKITKNNIIDTLRSKQYQKALLNDEISRYPLLSKPERRLDTVDIELLYVCFDSLAPKAKQILNDWMEGYSMKDIAERAGLKNENSASVTKKRCLIQLITSLENMGFFQ